MDMMLKRARVFHKRVCMILGQADMESAPTGFIPHTYFVLSIKGVTTGFVVTPFYYTITSGSGAGAGACPPWRMTAFFQRPEK
jgi:hypothetical protein